MVEKGPRKRTWITASQRHPEKSTGAGWGRRGKMIRKAERKEREMGRVFDAVLTFADGKRSSYKAGEGEGREEETRKAAASQKLEFQSPKMDFKEAL